MVVNGHVWEQMCSFPFPDYRGNVMVLLFNFGDSAFNVGRGDRIAQLVLERISMAELEELPSLNETDRGEGGFGSTGES